MKILLTGVGYLGDAIVENLLEMSHEVIVVDNLLYIDSYMRPNVKFYYGDVSDREFLTNLLIKESKIDVVVHTASIVGDLACSANSERTIQVNEIGTKNIVDVFKASKIVFTSTCSVYGASDNIVNEESPTNPLSLYAGTKLIAEQYLRNATRNHVIFRLGTLYGVSTILGRIRADLVGNILTYRAHEKKPLEIYGGEQYRPLIHVKDVGRIIAESVDEDYTGTYILSDLNWKIIDLASSIAYLADVPINVTEARFEDLRNYQVDNSKMKSVGIKTKIGLINGVEEMLNYLGEGRIKNPWATKYHNARFIKEMENE